MLRINLTGTHFEIGEQLGAFFRERGVLLPERVPFPVTRERLDFAQACLPFYREWYPAVLEEIRGLAQGQGCPSAYLEGALLPMYCLLPGSCCSTFAFRQGRRAVFGRNSDFLTCLEDLYISCSFRFSDGGLPFRGNTTAFVEMEDGVNQEGLAVGLTSAPPFQVRPGLGAGMLLRLVLESCRDVPQALALLERVPAGSSHTLVLADRNGEIALVENCGGRREILRPREESAWVCAVNAFHLPSMPRREIPPEENWQAEERHQTLCRALPGMAPAPDPRDAMDLLAGRRGFLCQYCRDTGHDTVWSVVWDAGTGKLWQADGNPSRVPFREEPLPWGASIPGSSGPSKI